MTRLVRLAVLAPLVAAPIAAQQPAAPPTRALIVANGAGEVSATPDRVRVTFSVTTRGRSASEAGRKNIAQMTPLLAALRRMQVPDSLMETAGYTVQREDEDWTGEGPKPREDSDIRYVANNAVTVTLIALDRLGLLVDTALAAGATEAEHITWTSSRDRELRLDALTLAVRSAREQAQVMARAAGGSLGELVELSIGANYYDGRVAGAALFSMSRVAVNTAISPQRLTIPSTVTARYAFIPDPRD